MIKFPITNVSTDKWTTEEDPTLFLFDVPYIYTSNQKLYYDYYYQQKYVDSNGAVYKIVDRRLPMSLLRRVFGFLPNVYKVELIFTKIGNEHWTLEDLRKYMIEKIRTYGNSKGNDEWLSKVKSAKTYEEVMGYYD